MSIEQMIREILVAVAKDRDLVRDLWLRRDPQTLSAGELVFPANRLNELLHEQRKAEVAQLVAMIERLLPFADMAQDEGPNNYGGWQSDKLQSTIAEARRLLDEMKPAKHEGIA